MNRLAHKPTSQRDAQPPRRWSLTRLGIVLAVLLATATTGSLLVQAPAQAAGACPSGYVQRAVWDEGAYTVYVFSTPDSSRVVGKVVNRGTLAIDVSADHGRSNLGRTSVGHGQSWCSNTAPQPITVWASPITDPLFYAHTYPAGAPVSGPN